ANVLRGLEGDDELNGGAGADTLIGGEGDDLYIVDQAGDVVTENPGEGTDTVRVLYGHKAKAAVTLSLQTTYANVENLEVLGAGLFNLVGNAEANALTGNGSANVIDGGAGADEMTGGLGNDTYVVDDAGDVVIETAVKGSGVDLVRASVDYTLTANVENLTLEGGALEGTGNALANVITGNSGNNVLSGGLGDDVLLGGAGNDALLGGAGNDWLSGGDGLNTLTGGTGEDVFYFDAAPVPGTLQTIADFSLIDDRIVFDATVFDALGAGFDDTPVALPSELLQVGSGSAAADADVRLIYDTAAGALYYDADGNGAGDAVQIAQFTGKPLLSADHFEVLAS
ncbi:calcium-binding protein, partial [Methyloversatilis discipulorum]|uniref:calcium-binding protein n=1 Tax=Methyloversatilis discipulorum TaxID=1119528 RepID=UPI003137DC77